MLALLVSLGGTATAADLLITSRDIKQGRLPVSVLPTIAARVYSSLDEPNPIQIAGDPVQRLRFDSVSFDTDHIFDPRRPTDLTAPVAGVYIPWPR